jgi:hypothetical protein
MENEGSPSNQEAKTPPLVDIDAEASSSSSSDSGKISGLNASATS